MSKQAGKISWEMLVGIAAIVTSCVAVGVAFYSAKIDRDYARTSVWPYLSVGYSGHIDQSDPEGGDVEGEEYSGLHREVIVANQGIGPAVVKYVTVQDETGYYQTWFDYLLQLDGAQVEGSWGQSHVGSGVIPAGEVVQALRVEGADNVFALNRDRSSLLIEVCYCSVYDTCWITTTSEEHVPVRECADPGENRFLQ